MIRFACGNIPRAQPKGENMSETQVWLTTHSHTVMLIGVACLVVSLVLLVICWLRRLSVRRPIISAKSGGVAVGGNNSGTIITGGKSGDKTPGSVDRLAVVAGWVTIFFALVGIILTFLAWQFPVQP